MNFTAVLRRLDDKDTTWIRAWSSHNVLDTHAHFSYIDILNALRRGAPDAWQLAVLNRRVLQTGDSDDQALLLARTFGTVPAAYLCQRLPQPRSVPQNCIFSAGYRRTAADLTRAACDSHL